MKVCFIGSGSIGTRHIKNLSHICSTRNISLQIDLFRETRKPLSAGIDTLVCELIYDYDKLPIGYDAIFITNPTHMHYETLKKVLTHTNCFFIEKPIFENSLKDLSPFLNDDKKYYIACPLRYTNVLLKAAEVVKKESILSVRAISSSYLPKWRKNIDYRETYSAHKAQGGGVRIDLIHEWDYIISLFGYPKEVYSLSNKMSNLEIDSEDIAVYIAQYKDKIIELHLDYFGMYTQRSLEFITTENNYIFDIYNSIIYCNGRVISRFDESPNDMYIREMEHFLKIVQCEDTSKNNIQTAIATIQVADL